MAPSCYRYQRHQPEHTLLYKVIAENFNTFVATSEAETRALPAYVIQEFREYLRRGILAHGFLRVVRGKQRLIPSSKACMTNIKNMNFINNAKWPILPTSQAVVAWLSRKLCG